jgi:carboxyl-terminal processing protease
LSTRLRLVVAAVIVAAAALGGAAYVGRASADDSAVVSQTGTRIAGLDLSLLSDASGDANRDMIAMAYNRVQSAYYKPFDDQTLIAGEHKALLGLLKERKIPHPLLPAAAATGDRTRDLALIQSSVSSAEKRYPQAATHDEYTQAAISGMLGALGDPYTVYLSQAEISGLEEQLQGGNFGGIGVYIAQDQKTGAIVVDPIEGNPAIKAGIRPGDIIVSVDNQSTMGQKLDAVERRIRGPLGTTVSLKIRRHDAGATQVVRVTRAEIHVPSVRAKMESGIDYVRLADFGQTSADEVRAAMLEGKRQHARGYILDLRNNGGGLLDAAVDISSLFIAQGTIVSTIDRGGDKESKSATGRSIGVTPLVLLVNKYTASASEITAGAVQDYHAGTIVGTRTFGKGVVQSLYNLPDRSALKITTARYVTPLGRDIHHKGVQPDVTIDQRVDVPIIDTANDKQLAAAKSIILKKDAANIK